MEGRQEERKKERRKKKREEKEEEGRDTTRPNFFFGSNWQQLAATGSKCIAVPTTQPAGSKDVKYAKCGLQ
jgi:hypothetical protein